MLETCASCPGLLPHGSNACPHCGAKVGRRAAAVRAIAGAVAAGGIAVTLMACYGMPAGSEGTDCDSDEDCWEGLACVDGYCDHVAVCGDGHLDEGEVCDDGGEVAGDGCNTDCTLEPDAFCAALPQLAVGTTSDNVESTGATATFTGSCLTQAAPERSYQFTAPEAGTLNVSLAQANGHGIYIRSGCAPDASELDCSTERGAATATLVAGEQVVVVVEGINGSTYTVETQFLPM